jgi:hypothetical protein
MARCSVCGTDSPASARYCANCGSGLGEVNRPSAFEVGRIAALDSVKSDIVKWLGVPFAIVTAAAGVLGYFGVTNLINSEVQSHVEKEMDKNFAKMTDEIMKRFVEISNEEGAIKTLEEGTRKTIDVSKQELSLLQENRKQLVASLAEIQAQKGVLTDSIQSAVNQEKQLQQTIAAMKLGPFIAKLRYDFYHTREFAVSTHVDFEPSIDPSLESFPHAEYVKLVSDSSSDGIGPLQLDRDRASGQSDQNGITGINIQFVLPIAEQNKVIGKKIDILSPLSEVHLAFYCNSQFRDKLESIVKFIKAAHLSVLINGRPFWQVDMSKPNLKLEESYEGDSTIFVIKMPLKYYGDTLLGRYEALFTDSDALLDQHYGLTPIPN